MSAQSGSGKIDRRTYEAELRKLQMELCSLQSWGESHGQHVIIVLEGREAAARAAPGQKFVDARY